MPMVAVYTASKQASEGFSGSLALEVEAFYVRVKPVEPGEAPTTRFTANDAIAPATPVNQTSLTWFGNSHAPNLVPDIVGHQQRAALVKRHAHRAPLCFAIGIEEIGQEIHRHP